MLALTLSGRQLHSVGTQVGVAKDLATTPPSALGSRLLHSPPLSPALSRLCAAPSSSPRINVSPWMKPHTCEVLTSLPEPLGACVYIPEPLLQIR